MFFFEVENLNDMATASFLLMTNLSMVFKITMFGKNYKLIRQVLDDLNMDIFRPTNHDETR
jgi:hypothetical protein